MAYEHLLFSITVYEYCRQMLRNQQIMISWFDTYRNLQIEYRKKKIKEYGQWPYFLVTTWYHCTWFSLLTSTIGANYLHISTVHVSQSYIRAEGPKAPSWAHCYL